MKILLISPPHEPTVTGAETITRNDVLTEPLPLEMLAGNLRDHDVAILDMRIDPALDEMLEAFQPDVVGITVYFTTSVYIVYRLLERVKTHNPSVKTVIGGHHPTLLPEDFQHNQVDVVVLGLGSFTFRELVDKWEKGEDIRAVKGLAIPSNGDLLFTAPRPFPENLDAIPPANRELVRKYRRRYFVGRYRGPYCIETELGCTHKCSFCSLWKFMEGRYMTRSAESVAEEICSREEKVMYFVDSHSFGNVERAKRLADRLKAANAKKLFILPCRADTVVKNPRLIEQWSDIGLRYVGLGFESFRDQDLRRLRKGVSARANEESVRILRYNGVEPMAYFIVDPEYEREDFQALQRYVDRLDLAYPIFSILTPLPGTDLFANRLPDLLSSNYELFDFVHCLLPTRLPLDVFYEEFVKLYDRSFSLQKQVRRLFPALLQAKADHRARFGIGSFLELTMAQLELKKLAPLVKEFHKTSGEILAAALQHTPGPGHPGRKPRIPGRGLTPRRWPNRTVSYRRRNREGLMKILLVQPPSEPTVTGIEPIVRSDLFFEPLALEYLASAVKDHDVEILDLRMEPSLRDALERFRPDLVGVTCLFTTGTYIAMQVLKEAKDVDPEVVTVIGGLNPTVQPEDFNRPFIDVIVLGMGEDTFPELVRAQERGAPLDGVAGIALPGKEGLRFTQARPLPKSLDGYPLPNRELVRKYRGNYHVGPWSAIYSVLTQLGCTKRCKFCSIWKSVSGCYITRSAEAVVEEVAALEGRYVFFADSHWLGDPNRIERLYELIRERGIKKKYVVETRTDIIVKRPDIIEKWAEIGLSVVGIGLESFRDEELKDLNKQNTIQNNEEAVHILRRNGIEPTPSFIIPPHYQKSDFEDLLYYVTEKLHLIYPVYASLTPFPGTDLFEEKKEQLEIRNYELFDCIHAVLPTHMPREAYYNEMLRLYEKSFSLKRHVRTYLKRFLRITSNGERDGVLPRFTIKEILMILSQLKLRSSLPGIALAHEVERDAALKGEDSLPTWAD